MSRSWRHLLLSLFIVFAWGLTWLALWTISFYLTNNGQQATLLLPQGVHLALLILLHRRYWPALFIPVPVMLTWLWQQQLMTEPVMLLSPFISAIPALFVQHYWHRFTLYWQRLSLLMAAIASDALLHTLALTPFINSSASQTLLDAFTGGVVLTPFVYLIYEYLRQQHLESLLAQETPNPPLRTSLLVWCSLFFIIGVGAQMVVSPEIERLLLIVVFLPNVVMAYKFGWQGGVLAALLGSMMITIARQIGSGFNGLMEMELFLSTQALLGIGLGIAISRQQHLANNLHRYRQRLEVELQARRELMEQLVHTEEDTRKDLARELHDEIGQNITAIQIQSMLVKRTASGESTVLAAEQINQLAQRIHHSTRHLLRQLRPPVLDEISLDEALHHLIQEFAFTERGIRCRLHYALPGQPASEPVVFTLYRLVQELLNNICKHANASLIEISLTEQPCGVRLEVKDDGVGFSGNAHSGQGLRGIAERIRALGGDLQLESQSGTRVIVNLPTLFQQIQG
ncbi:MASE1 domain-containing protein [Buttiauxella sp. WJP83]|uniref:MASE1 domain-containing sensor histidine kinase n=1 Tax=Buttiauxella sp. WJP83 TaxID=2986951 RepID=UPI0022DE12D7|nr:MASE1 domain-containing protein [Buttiauxella sp. WJP83]WBM68851.1 MASE1 domain-containing protein [Buttiauxella sp. WJP83]